MIVKVLLYHLAIVNEGLVVGIVTPAALLHTESREEAFSFSDIIVARTGDELMII